MIFELRSKLADGKLDDFLQELEIVFSHFNGINDEFIMLKNNYNNFEKKSEITRSILRPLRFMKIKLWNPDWHCAKKYTVFSIKTFPTIFRFHRSHSLASLN